ncbi:MAG: hypothetical protein MZV70_43100 [Desulfobacterales bacterium]|nr:hypothetical protein [Desulfobacterales bacterium]
MFGGLWQPSTLSYAVEQFFENGGAAGRDRARRERRRGRHHHAALRPGDALTLAALEPGLARGAARLGRLRQHRAPDEADRFNLVVQRAAHARLRAHRGPGDLPARLSVAPDTTRFVATALQESQLVRVRGAGAGHAPGPDVPRRLAPPDRLRRLEPRRRRRRARSPTTT